MKFKLVIFKFVLLLSKHRILTGFFISFLVLIVLDLFFNGVFENFNLEETLFADQIGFAPEVWLSVLSLVLGTLIIVISIASQGTPRLIDLYLNNWPSIFYIWFIVLSSVHSILYIMFAVFENRVSSGFLNSYLLLPIALLGSLPYIFFILNYSKVDNVIQVLYLQVKSRLHIVSKISKLGLLENKEVVSVMQKVVLEKINQLTALFYFVGYNESKQIVLDYLIRSLLFYAEGKKEIDSRFFFISGEIRQDLAFSNYIEYQFQKMEKRQSFFEEKILKEVGLIYNSFLEQKNYGLASSCCAKVVEVGKYTIEKEDEIMTSLITIRINTMFRYSLKHSLNVKSTRIINNFVFQTGKLLDVIITLKKSGELFRMYDFIQIYGNELYVLSLKNKMMKFSYISLLAEVKRSIIRMNEEDWDNEIQEKLLGRMLSINSFKHSNKEAALKEREKNDKYRMIYLGLALYYCGDKKFDLALFIVRRLLNDLERLNGNEKYDLMEYALNKLKDIPLSFWEDNDRGSFNVYYVSETDLIEPLLKLISKIINEESLERD